MWENVLLCQFHDCLPGSAIEMCYDDSDKLYAKVFKTGNKILQDAIGALGFDQSVASGPASDMVLETLSWDRDSPLKKAKTLPRVTVKEGNDNVFILENDQLKVEVTEGTITSLYDIKAKREIIPKGQKANQLVIFDDKPLYWQAWDVEIYHLGSRKELTAESKSEITESGPERVAVSTKTRISEKSWIKTTVSLSASKDDDQPALVETEAEVEWHETMKFLKVEFPTTITNTEASYETQYGIVRRPTHYNTTWDVSKFEVVCHRFADLSENGYGVSILNDSKYGFATAGNLMRLSLLRAPKAPDAHTDMGRHHIKWAIMPHAGALGYRTVRAGFEFNYPVRIHQHACPAVAKDLFRAFKLTPNSNPSLILDAVKRGEDDADASNGDLPVKKGRHVILRVYDSLGGLSRGIIGMGPVKVSKAWKVNILEDELEELKLNEEGLEIELRAFEVASYKLLLA